MSFIRIERRKERGERREDYELVPV